MTCHSHSAGGPARRAEALRWAPPEALRWPTKSEGTHRMPDGGRMPAGHRASIHLSFTSPVDDRRQFIRDILAGRNKTIVEDDDGNEIEMVEEGMGE